MARYKILLLNAGGVDLGEMTVDAIFRSDAIDMGARAAEETAPDCCAYEVWRDLTARCQIERLS